MSLLTIAKERYSVRSYKDIPVEKEKILKIMEAARVAPSACNYQPWQFKVVQKKEMLSKVASSYSGSWIKEAPVIVVVCGDHRQSWHRNDGKDHMDIDIAIAVDHLTLAAADMGLGTCWICAFDAKKCHKILELPEHIEPVALIPVGYPAVKCNPDRHETKRKKLEKIVEWL